MRQILVSAVLVAAFAAPAFAKTETVRGQLVDQSCYMKDKVNNKGVDHKMPADTTACAIACAKMGQPLALLTADGRVFTIAGGLTADKNAKLVPHMGHTIEITGDTMDMKTSMMITADALTMISR